MLSCSNEDGSRGRYDTHEDGRASSRSNPTPLVTPPTPFPIPAVATRMGLTVCYQFGYRTTPEIMAFLKESLELRKSLSAAAHLIHGSSEKRFTVTYCPGGLSREDIEGGEQ